MDGGERTSQSANLNPCRRRMYEINRIIIGILFTIFSGRAYFNINLPNTAPRLFSS